MNTPQGSVDKITFGGAPRMGVAESGEGEGSREGRGSPLAD